MGKMDEAVERARAGDKAAFGALVRRHQKRVTRIAMRMMGNLDDAHDVAQEAFIRAFRGLKSFKAESDFFTWLYRIVINVSMNHLQQRQRQRRRTASLDDVTLPPTLGAQDDPRRALEQKQMIMDLDEALDALSPSLRATIVLVVQEGMSYQDAAEILECSKGTVSWRVHEARQKLRESMKTHLEHGVGEKNKDDLPGYAAKAIDVR